MVKYGQREHLEAALETGRLRLSPASKLDDPTLNRAQQARELELEFELDTKRSRVEILSADKSQSFGKVDPLRLTIARKAPTDFYVWCASRTLSARLFFDFSADACLVIADRGEFLRRLAAAAEGELPGWRLAEGAVRYYDPFSRWAERASIPFWKPVGYEYQSEYRTVFVPSQPPVAPLDFVWMDLGPLGDIATLFVP